MTDNLKEAPLYVKKSQKEQMIEKIKEEGKKILDKYFGNRNYDKDKVELWKDYTIEDVTNFLEKKYQDFGFVISIIVINGYMWEDSNQICRNTDGTLNISESFNTMYCLMRIYFIKFQIHK